MALAEACVKDFAPETGEGKIDASSLAATHKYSSHLKSLLQSVKNFTLGELYLILKFHQSIVCNFGNKMN